MNRDITAKDLHNMLAKGEAVHIIDVRTKPEFASGHIPGARHIPLGSIGRELPEVSTNGTIVMVCRSGARSGVACQRIISSHPNVVNLTGGIGEWRAAGFEVEAPPKGPSRSIDRQTHLVAGIMLIAAFLLSRTVNSSWIYLALLPAFGLMLDALTGICPMTLIIRKMPWNVG